MSLHAQTENASMWDGNATASTIVVMVQTKKWIVVCIKHRY